MRFRLRVEIKLDHVAVEQFSPCSTAFLFVRSSWRSVSTSFWPRNRLETLEPLVGENTNLVREVALQLLDHLLLDLLGALVLLLALAAEDTHVDHGAFDTRRARQRSVAHVAGLFAEDGSQQLLFRSQLGLALGRYLADQDVVMPHLGADADDTRLVQVTQSVLGNVGNITRDLFRSKLGVARLNLELFDMNRSVVVLADQLFRNQDRILEVVAAPRQ